MITPQIFAAMYVTAMKIREDSFKIRSRRVYDEDGDDFVSASGVYGKSYEEAAREACATHHQHEVWARPIELLMIGTWNDAEDWARKLI